MKIVAIVLAGGSGTRMKSTIPKQFLEIDSKPLIVYTLEKLEDSKHIHSIIVVCNSEYIDYLSTLVDKYQLHKIIKIVPGGESGIDSTYRGICAVPAVFDTVLIHDGNRPMIDNQIIDNAISVYQIHGNAVSAIPTVELTYESKDGISSLKYIDRDSIWKTHTPQLYKYNEVKEIYDRVFHNNPHPSYSSTTEMYCANGLRIYFSAGKTSNIKITYPEDLDIFLAMLKSKKERRL